MIPVTSRKNDLASFRWIMRHPFRLIYRQGQGKVLQRSRADGRKETIEEGARQRWWEDKKRCTKYTKQWTKKEKVKRSKREGEREESNRRQTATSGRLHEPEAAVYSIWQARYSPGRLLNQTHPLILPSSPDRRRMKYALAWISNGVANRIRPAMNLPTKPRRTKLVKFWGRDEGCVCTFERQGWFKRPAWADGD